MKTLFTSVALLCFATFSFAQIPNAGFENWTSQGSYNTPDGWDNFNQFTSLGGSYTCAKGTPGNTGSSYLKLTTKNISGIGVVPGMAVSGEMDYSSFEPISGFAISQRPQSLTGSWQYMAYGSDAGYIAVYLTKWNTTTNHRDVISYTKYDLPGMVMMWAPFSIDLTYTSTESPDSGIIVLSASGATAAVNDFLYVDDLAFAGGTMGVSENLLKDVSLSVYPNPAISDRIQLECKGKAVSLSTVEIFDIYGRTVKQVPVEKTQDAISIDVHDLAAGHYILKGSNKDGMVVTHFVKQ